MLFKVKPEKNKTLPKNSPLWYHGGRLVLDHDNHPMREFFEILPTVLSSKTEGWLMEAVVRIDHRILMKDLRGRMPKEIVVDRKGQQQLEPLFTMQTITQRRLNFRRDAGLMVSAVRGGTDAINAGLKKLLPAECLTKNTTKSLASGLTAKEIKDITKPNEGKYPQRGRVRKTASGTTQASGTDTSKKRKRRETSTDLSVQGEQVAEDRNCRPSKRGRHGGVQSAVNSGPNFGLPTPELSTPGSRILDYPNVAPLQGSDPSTNEGDIPCPVESMPAGHDADSWDVLLAPGFGQAHVNHSAIYQQYQRQGAQNVSTHNYGLGIYCQTDHHLSGDFRGNQAPEEERNFHLGPYGGGNPACTYPDPTMTPVWYNKIGGDGSSSGSAPLQPSQQYDAEGLWQGHIGNDAGYYHNGDFSQELFMPSPANDLGSTENKADHTPYSLLEPIMPSLSSAIGED